MTETMQKACDDYAAGRIDAMPFRQIAKLEGMTVDWCDDKLDEMDHVRYPEYYKQFG